MDDRVKVSGSRTAKSPGTPHKSTYVSNFEHVPIGSTIVQGEPKSTKGYIVFNSHTQFVQEYGASKDVTRAIALQVIDSVLHGRFPKGYKYDAITTFVKGYHLLTYEIVHRDGVAVYNYHCACKAGRSEAECSHEAAGEEINKTFCIKDQVARNSSGKVAGRPKKRLAVGYSAHKPDEYSDCELGKHDYEAWVCELIVQFFHLRYSPKPFVGKITGTYYYYAAMVMHF